MAFDAVTVRALTGELSHKLVNGRIDKIYQPEKDEITINIRLLTENVRLVLSASSAHPRVHLTKAAKKNPISAPMFCMLLRKHIGGGKITAVEQEGFERIIRISVESYDELGDLTTKYLIAEIMGRHSNIILTNADMKIIDCIKHIDFTISSVRQVMPGLTYTAPPPQGKTDLTDIRETASVDFSAASSADKAVLSCIGGISPLTAREIVYDAMHTTDVHCAALTDSGKNKILYSLTRLARDVREGNFSPCVILNAASGKPMDFSVTPIGQYETLAEVRKYDGVSEMLDAFFITRDMQERMRQKSADLVKLINTNTERISKKLAILARTVSESENRDKYKIYGDLLTANLHSLKQGQDSFDAQNYYEEGAPTVSIALDPRLTPSQNAQKYYKKYSKAKTALVEAAKQIESGQSELEYLESTLTAVENAENDEDLNAIRAELAAQGYAGKGRGQKKRAKQSPPKPLHFVTSDGFDVYVGKNNTQNDYLTLKFANSSDLWFHTKNIHGSHAIIKLGVNKDVPRSSIEEAARAAAYYSKARSSSQVPVDYTRIKNVRKPNGAKPGMVIYEGYNTIYVTPENPIKE